MASNHTDDQSRYLPSEDASINLPEIITLEERHPDLRRWLAVVTWTLNPFGLKRLVSTEIPRPAVGNSAYNRWKYWSTMVGRWLYRHISEALRKKIFPAKPRTPTSYGAESCESDFADYLIESVISYVEDRRWSHQCSITRRRYETAKGYVNAYRTQFTLVHSNKCAPSPREALKTMLYELRNELPIIESIRKDVAAHAPADFTIEIFHHFCQVIVSECDRIPFKPGWGGFDDLHCSDTESDVHW